MSKSLCIQIIKCLVYLKFFIVHTYEDDNILVYMRDEGICLRSGLLQRGMTDKIGDSRALKKRPMKTGEKQEETTKHNHKDKVYLRDKE